MALRTAEARRRCLKIPGVTPFGSAFVQAARRLRRASGLLLRLLLALLFGAVLAPAQGLSPGGPVDFGSSNVGVPAGKISLNFTAVVTTTISAVNVSTTGAANLDFQLEGDTCIGVQAPPSTCLITLQFTPTAAGLRKGWLSVTDDSGNIVNNVPLRGVGVAPLMVVSSPVTPVATTAVAGLTPATFLPTASVMDGAGNLYFNDISNGRILEQLTNTAERTIGNLAGSTLSSMAINGYGTLFVSAPAQGAVYSLIPQPSTSFSTPKRIATPGVTLVTPTGVAVDGSGYLYIADAGANAIIRVAQDGSSAVALTLAGLSLPLLHPDGLAMDASHNLYIADAGNNRVVRFSLTTGKAAPLTVSGITLSNPTALAVSPSDTVTVADTGNARFVTVASNGSGSVLALPGITADEPAGATFLTNGDLVLADENAGLIRLARSAATYVFPTATPLQMLDATDGSFVATVSDQGNATLQLNIPATGSNPSQTGVAYNLSASGTTCPTISAGAAPGPANQLLPDGSCSFDISFTPVNTVLNPSTVTFGGADTSGYSGTAITLNLDGTGVSRIARFTVVASPSPTTVGAPVTLTVTAIDTSGLVYTGYLGRITFTATDPTAQFLFGGSYLFTAADNGVHTFAAPSSGVTFGSIGTFTVSVADDIYTGTSNPVVVQANSAVVLTATPNPVQVGNTVTLTATVADASAGTSGTPTGSIQFTDGTTVLGTATVANGVATITVTFSTTGTHSLTAAYGGDSSFVGSTGTATETVNPKPSASAVSLNASPNPVLVNGSATLTAVVSGAATSTGTPTGSVQFLDGTTVLGTATVTNGIASLPAGFNTAGLQSLTAVYSGDNSFLGSTGSGSLTVLARQIAPAISLNASPNPALLSNPVTLTATVGSNGASGSAPTGSVQFLDGTAVLGVATLTNGGASITATFSTSGAHSLSVVYSGDTIFLGGTATASETVVDFTVTLAPNGSGAATVLAGYPAGYSLMITPVGAANLPGGLSMAIVGLPTGATGTFSPASLASGAGTTPVALSVGTAAKALDAHKLTGKAVIPGRPGTGSMLRLAFLGLLAPLALRRRRPQRLLSLLLLLSIGGVLSGLTGCLSTASSGYYDPTPNTSILTVSATAGSLTHSLNLQLTVE